MSTLINKLSGTQINNPIRPTSESDLKHVPDEYKKISRGMESQFLEFMISQMDKTIGRGEQNSAEKFYRSMLTSERAQAMAKNQDGLGLQKLILDQLYPKKFRNKANYENYLRLEKAKQINNNRIKHHTSGTSNVNAIKKYHQAEDRNDNPIIVAKSAKETSHE